MTVSSGNKALASDYETLATRVDEWFTNDCTSCVFGDVDQDYGWGGTTTPEVSPGNDMLASQMNEIIDRINIAVNITNVSGTLTRLNTGDSVLSSQYNNADAKEILVRAQRNIINAIELSSIPGNSDQRSSNYSASINATFRYDFSDFNDARYFFNSGGTLDFDGSISGYSTGWTFDGQGINEILTTMGVVSMNYTSTTQSGSGGSTSLIGFYDLTTSYQNIFSQTGTGVYSDASLTLQARRGPLADWIEVNVIIAPETGKIVNGTTTFNADYKKLDDQNSGSVLLQINPPGTVTVVDTFE